MHGLNSSPEHTATRKDHATAAKGPGGWRRAAVHTPLLSKLLFIKQGIRSAASATANAVKGTSGTVRHRRSVPDDAHIGCRFHAPGACTRCIAAGYAAVRGRPMPVTRL
ncbi:hypothetical protein B5T_00600 [Alloalcanivorax dieselolei B5]|uniref:Uncharacterized protein n=1 Tax=Alcanivorax dieselolei (strain DSM 16502 / CGMCC 1.3690 / MCCC 1A00001 / B-5) TaxID=930169 RepID=K0C8P2_ALCDB|nr:hypothetical protein B5T_00600 [Alloalcanivorax dieselolei B5]